MINWFSINKMQAEKYQVIFIDRKTHDKNTVFDLSSISISREDEVNLVGVIIDYKLNFSIYI